jgi:hypothetical protein
MRRGELERGQSQGAPLRGDDEHSVRWWALRVDVYSFLSHLLAVGLALLDRWYPYDFAAHLKDQLPMASETKSYQVAADWVYTMRSLEVAPLVAGVGTVVVAVGNDSPQVVVVTVIIMSVAAVLGGRVRSKVNMWQMDRGARLVWKDRILASRLAIITIFVGLAVMSGTWREERGGASPARMATPTAVEPARR